MLTRKQIWDAITNDGKEGVEGTEVQRILNRLMDLQNLQQTDVSGSLPLTGAKIIDKAINRSKLIAKDKYDGFSFRFGFIAGYEDALSDASVATGDAQQTKDQLLEVILKNVVYFTDFNAIKKAVEDYTKRTDGWHEFENQLPDAWDDILVKNKTTGHRQVWKTYSLDATDPALKNYLWHVLPE